MSQDLFCRQLFTVHLVLCTIMRVANKVLESHSNVLHHNWCKSLRGGLIPHLAFVQFSVSDNLQAFLAPVARQCSMNSSVLISPTDLAIK